QRPVETVDDLAGLSRSHPGVALVMVVFLFSLIGIPLTGGFAGKLLLFLGAMSVRPELGIDDTLEQARLFRILALIGALNAAVGAWYSRGLGGVCSWRTPRRRAGGRRGWPVLTAIGVCALVTVVLGVYPWALLRPAEEAVPRTPRPAEERAER